MLERNLKQLQLGRGTLKSNSPLHDISLRDQFAIAALPAMITHHSKAQEYSYISIAEHTYDMADAMIKERSKSANSRYGTKKDK